MENNTCHQNDITRVEESKYALVQRSLFAFFRYVVINGLRIFLFLNWKTYNENSHQPLNTNDDFISIEHDCLKDSDKIAQESQSDFINVHAGKSDASFHILMRQYENNRKTTANSFKSPTTITENYQTHLDPAFSLKGNLICQDAGLSETNDICLNKSNNSVPHRNNAIRDCIEQTFCFNRPKFDNKTVFMRSDSFSNSKSEEDDMSVYSTSYGSSLDSFESSSLCCIDIKCKLNETCQNIYYNKDINNMKIFQTKRCRKVQILVRKTLREMHGSGKKKARKAMRHVIGSRIKCKTPYIEVHPLLRGKDEGRLSRNIATSQECPSQKMHIEMFRLYTFRNYPAHQIISMVRLAQTGFYFAGIDDQVQCFSCEVKHNGWTPSDNPCNVHREISPQCRMVLDREPRNIPIHQRDTNPEHGNNNLVHQESIFLEQTGFNELNGSTRLEFGNRIPTNGEEVIPEQESISQLPLHQHSTEFDELDGLEAYKMNARPRGKAVIINNKKFSKPQDGNRILADREGSERDAERLVRVWEKLNFSVEKYSDLTSIRMIEIAERFAGMDHSKFDCFVVCIMTHGGRGYLYDVDGKKVDIHHFTECFINSKCQSLVGKPKLFFVQACQGNTYQASVELMTDAGDDFPGNSNITRPIETIPDCADFFLSFATVYGNVSFRDSLDGSWYISILSRYLEQLSQRSDIDMDRIITKVHDEVAKKELITNGQIIKQMPVRMSTLRKLVFFR